MLRVRAGTVIHAQCLIPTRHELAGGHGERLERGLQRCSERRTGCRAQREQVLYRWGGRWYRCSTCTQRRYRPLRRRLAIDTPRDRLRRKRQARRKKSVWASCDARRDDRAPLAPSRHSVQLRIIARDTRTSPGSLLGHYVGHLGWGCEREARDAGARSAVTAVRHSQRLRQRDHRPAARAG